MTPAESLSEMLSRTHEAMGKPRPISPRPVVKQLLADISTQLSVLRLDGIAITDEQIDERANNIVTSLLGNYRIEEI